MDPKCPCKYDEKTRQYRDCKRRSCKPKPGQGLNELEKAGNEIKKFLKGLVKVKDGGSTTFARKSKKSK